MAETWNKITGGYFGEVKKKKTILDLKEYCKLDTYAMYAIRKHLADLIY